MSGSVRSGNAKDVAAGLLFVFMGVAGCGWSFTYPMGSAQQMGPGYFPALVFGLLALVGLVVFVNGLRDGHQALEPWAVLPLFLVLGSLVAFALLLPRAGFLLASMAMVLLVTQAVTAMPFWQRLALAAAVTGFCWLVFIKGLGLLIPTFPDWGA